jgi:hypothetical protein
MVRRLLCLLVGVFCAILSFRNVDARTWDVPHDVNLIAVAIDSAATTGDIINVTQDHSENGLVNVYKSVTITRNSA